MNTVIAGAGIGGLTLAIALKRRGMAVRVLERATELGPVGAGITVQPNAMLALRSLGLDAEVAAAGAIVQQAAVTRPDGQVLSGQDMGELARQVGAPAVAIHRARLHDILLRAAGDSVVTVGSAVQGFADEGPHVRVKLSSGAEVTGDLLIGADGVRSAVRAQLIGDGEPVYAGYSSWRGVLEAPDLTGLPTTETWGRGLRFGVVPVNDREVYWFAVADAPAGEQVGDVRAALETRFGSWHAPIPRLIRETPLERILRTDIADRPALASYHKGRVALLGDAAHPMTPNLGQGGCQAIEDAVVLAAALAETPDLAQALARYDSERVKRANDVVIQARRIGAVGQWANPLLCWVRDTLVRALPSSWSAKQASALWHFEVPS